MRRAWLCGFDDYLGKSFEHRKPWIEQRILQMGEIFARGIYAYAVMSNHFKGIGSGYWHDCDEMQGYFFGPGVPANAIESQLRNKHRMIWRLKIRPISAPCYWSMTSKGSVPP